MATKEVCREMSSPTRGSWARAKRFARYFVSREKVVYRCERLFDEPSLDLYTDSDWADCRRIRRSTTGGVLMRGPRCLNTWSLTQDPIPWSSAEAEYYAMVDGVMRAIGMQAMCEEIGLKGVSGPISLRTDSSSAKSFASRRGLGKARRIQIRCLWLQQGVADRRVLANKVAGTAHPADLLTKYFAVEPAGRVAMAMGLELRWRPCAWTARAEGV